MLDNIDWHLQVKSFCTLIHTVNYERDGQTNSGSVNSGTFFVETRFRLEYIDELKSYDDEY